MTRFVALAASTVLVACAADDTPRPQAAFQQRCVVEPPTGSNIRVTRCFSRETDVQNRREVKDFEEEARRGPARTGNLSPAGG
jgi:hypothetical protein